MNASQLHVTYVDLAAIAQRGDIALLVTVLQAPSDARGYVMRARIDEVWSPPVRDEEGWADAVPPEPARHTPGDEHDFTIYCGVEWDDPSESPTDFRVRGAISAEEVHRHDRVVVVRGPFGFELLPWSEAMARKLALFFGDGGLEAYRRSTTSAQLQVDLADP
ncbi:MAG: hypothetical protein ACOCZB_09450, partial [Spirochaetota bacterium]